MPLTRQRTFTMTTSSLFAAVITLISAPGLVVAQGRSTLYSLSTLDASAGKPLLYGDLDYGERTFERVGGERFEHLLGAQLSLPQRLTLAARASIATDTRTTRLSQQVELLRDFLGGGATRTMSLAAGLGLTREYGGTTTLFSRVALARSWRSQRLVANAIFEKPFAPGRDAVDIITSAAWMHGAADGVQLGLEAVGQDLEGFWEADEAEGGARLFFGPAVTVPLGWEGWRFSFGAGQVFRATSSPQTSDASRPVGSDRSGYVLRMRVSAGG